MSIHALWVINKAGGLVYNKTLSNVLPPLTQNEALVLAGTMHGIHAITSKLSPVPGKNGSGGVEVIEGEGVKMIVMLTGTGTKFVLLVSPSYPSPPGANTLLAKIYEAYSDAVMKNPFHTSEMPIRSEGFDLRVAAIVKEASNPGGYTV